MEFREINSNFTNLCRRHLVSKQRQCKTPENKTSLMNAFKMSDLDEPKKFLGMTIQRDRETKAMTISQEDYINKILLKFGFEKDFPKNTPMITRQVANHERRAREEDDNEHQKDCTLNIPYREAIGSLLYLSGATRPDIAYAVNLLSRH